MHTYTFSDDERTLLLGLLQSRLKELSHEIHQTDSHSYRESLVAEQNMLEQLTSKVQNS